MRVDGEIVEFILPTGSSFTGGGLKERVEGEKERVKGEKTHGEG